MNQPQISRKNKDHCWECKCRDIAQPDELNEAGTNGLMTFFFGSLSPLWKKNLSIIYKLLRKMDTSFAAQISVGVMYGPGQGVILNTAGHTLLWQLEGTSCIEVTDGAPRTVMADDKVIVHRKR